MGVWLPRQGIELELDLADLQDAPAGGSSSGPRLGRTLRNRRNVQMAENLPDLSPGGTNDGLDLSASTSASETSPT